MDILAEPVGSALRFAGEATNRRYPASVHGAYMSGVREARLVQVRRWPRWISTHDARGNHLYGLQAYCATNHGSDS